MLALDLLDMASAPPKPATPQPTTSAPDSPATKAGLLDAFKAAQPGCGEAKYCFSVALHVVTREGQPAQSPSWFGTQLREANRHFAAIHTGFEIESVDALDVQFAHIATREDRDRVGRKVFSRGVIHVFLVEQLDDVDAVGEQIRGLHWRQRSNIEKRWVILSKIAPDMVLAHEFGHFFSLPHSTYAVSIMNKRPRESPPRSERTFHVEEVVKMRAFRNEMVRDGMLRKR